MPEITGENIFYKQGSKIISIKYYDLNWMKK